MKVIRLSILLLLLHLSISGSTLLDGKHLVVGLETSPIHLYAERNASGHVMQIQGVAVETLIALSERFNFTYSILQVNDTRLEKRSDTLLGLNYYMAQGKCDLVIGSIGMTFGRHAVMDLADGYAYTSIAIVIPMPEESQNIDAALEPFQLWVWVALVMVMPITAFAIYFVGRPVNCKRSSDESVPTTRTAEKASVCSETRAGVSQALFQIFRVLIGQGGNFLAKRSALYFVVGSWCLCATVVIFAYNSTLISHILRSNVKPLVKSIVDLVENPAVHIAVNKGNGLDLVMSASVDGIYSQAGAKVRSNSNSRCVTTKDCVDLVKSGSYAYFITMYNALAAINDDYTASETCRLAVARKSEPLPGSLAWALPKGSRYTRLFNMGFIELEEAGLIDHWTKNELGNFKHATYCLGLAGKRQQQTTSSKENTKITLTNISGPLDFLLTAYLVSFAFFVYEIGHFKVTNYYKKWLSSRNVTTVDNVGLD